MLQFGGFIGIALMGIFAARFGYYKVLATVFAMGCAGIALISFVTHGLFDRLQRLTEWQALFG